MFAARSSEELPSRNDDTLASRAAPGPDLFGLGRQAAAKARQLGEGRGLFARSKRLLGTGAWHGPRDAADAYVEAEDLPALGGLRPAIDAGVRTFVASIAPAASIVSVASVTSVPSAGSHGLSQSTRGLLAEATEAELRIVLRLPFTAGEGDGARQARLAELARALAQGLTVDGVMPTPQGEPQGLDTLAYFATTRLALPVPHVLADFARLGHRLAQMALGFGADELWGPIHPERSLRLGANAGNPIMTRKEAGILLRGAGLLPWERLSGGRLEEVTP